MTMLNVALDCIQRGWYVFPCKPRKKEPLGALAPHGWKDATNDEAQVRQWWNRAPDANVAIACNMSGLAVLDVDHGLDGNLGTFARLMDIPPTYAVRTGRRPEFGLQFYFQGTMQDVGEWEFAGCSGQIKSAGGYVMAAGSIHPDSGEAYTVYGGDSDIRPALIPASVRALKTERKEAAKDDGEPITENRNNRLTSIAGKLRNAGLSADALRVALLQVNADRCCPPLDDDEVERIAANASQWELPEESPIPVLSKPKAEAKAEPEPPKDWREKYHSFEEMADAPEPEFLIDGFLLYESITGIAAPVAQRKSIIALNVAHALCTGEPLFGHQRFAIRRKPSRVLYLCPEMGIRSFTKRLRAIGLLDYVGKTLFCRTMSCEDELKLSGLTNEELLDAVVIIDTAVRFMDGDESKSEHMRAFAKEIFRLSKEGKTAAVVLLHHSLKGTKESNELTLENAMRGSGELGAFLTGCWATRLQDPEDQYKSLSYLTDVKPRDFESKPFNVSCDANYKMTFDGADDIPAVLVSKPSGNQSNRDGKDDIGKAIIQATGTKATIRELKQTLADAGVKRSTGWISERRAEIFGKGSTRKGS